MMLGEQIKPQLKLLKKIVYVYVRARVWLCMWKPEGQDLGAGSCLPSV